MIGHNKPTRQCSKRCIANVGGRCAVEHCRGPVVQMHMGQNRTLDISAQYYHYIRYLYEVAVEVTQ